MSMPTAPAIAQSVQAASVHKPKVLHIVKDNKVGGVRFTLGGLVNSDLSQQFEFTVIQDGAIRPLLTSLRLHPDVIICHQPLRLKALPGLLLLKWLNPNAKLMIHEHGYSQGYERYNVPSVRWFRFILRLAFSLCDRVVAISHAHRDWMLNHQLVSPDKLSVIRQSPPLQKFAAVQPKPLATPLTVVAYGRFCPQKGFDVLLRAMRQLQDQPIHLRLGGEGVQAAELKLLADELPNVEWVGRVDDVPGFLQACDAVVVPSRWEPWGNVCLEAKAAGRPVIASDVDGLTEQAEGFGLLVPPDDPEQLACAIQSLLLIPPEQFQEWGRRGRAAVMGHADQYLVEWKALLWKMLEQA